jgi:hypothetical protein
MAIFSYKDMVPIICSVVTEFKSKGEGMSQILGIISIKGKLILLMAVTLLIVNLFFSTYEFNIVLALSTCNYC